MEIYQLLVRLLDGKHKALNFTLPSISVESIKNCVYQFTSIPPHVQLLRSSNGSHVLNGDDALNLRSDGLDGRFPTVVHLSLRLRGGKGGFGSLLRGAATKAGQKKTSNFDACRDMSGRRLRHVNAEKKLEEWRAEEEERKLEKIAEEFIKKKTKEAMKKGGSSGDAERYVAKYREDSAKCMEEVEKSVRESMKDFVSSKRKVGEANGSHSKRLKVWMGKRALGESDNDDSDEGDSDVSDDDAVDEGNTSNSTKEVNGSSGSDTDGRIDGESDTEEKLIDEGSPESSGNHSGSAITSEEAGNLLNESAAENSVGQIVEKESLLRVVASEAPPLETEVLKVNKVETTNVPGTVDHQPIVSSLGGAETPDGEVIRNSDPECANSGETTAVAVDNLDVQKPLNFDDNCSAVELEALGMERLKVELQARGLKCGGTQKERAARLFLLKTTPLEKLPKKLLAKK